MYEAICDVCSGTGKTGDFFMVRGERHDHICPVCDGSGIATADEQEEFDTYIQKEQDSAS